MQEDPQGARTIAASSKAQQRHFSMVGTATDALEEAELSALRAENERLQAAHSSSSESTSLEVALEKL